MQILLEVEQRREGRVCRQHSVFRQFLKSGHCLLTDWQESLIFFPLDLMGSEDSEEACLV